MTTKALAGLARPSALAMAMFCPLLRFILLLIHHFIETRPDPHGPIQQPLSLQHRKTFQLLVTTPTMQFIVTERKHLYIVTTINGSGTESANSNRARTMVPTP